RSLRRTLRTHPFRISVNTAFEEVMNACGTERAGGTWIIPELIAGYVKLNELGWAHSLEVWEGELLVGGIYGVAVGAAFAGESMFHRRTDASKIAFATLAERLKESGYLLFDAQVKNPHLTSLGCIEIKRTDYLERLAKAVATVPRVRINAWGRGPCT
ncbi:MAG TPA: leucyl/phenylalanyl-tRNA--protein transferase, partial [Polyangiaceae bacterium]